MAFTGRLGTGASQPGQIILGAGDIGGFNVTATDTVTTTESVSVLVGYFRTAEDTTSTSEIVDHTSSGNQQYTRSAVDTTSLTESPARILGASRAISDTTSTSESIASAQGFTVTATDTTSTSDSIASSGGRSRTLTDTITTSDSIAQLFVGTRTLTDTTTTIAVPMHLLDETITPEPILPPGYVPSPGAPRPVPVSITVEGVELVDYVDFRRSRFTTYANGNPGQCEVWIKDVERSISVPVGAEIRVTYRGVRVWGGFALGVKREYAFSAGTGTGTEPRYLVLEGADYNILMRKRLYLDPAAPTNGIVHQWPNGTQDSVVISQLVNQYLDLSGDGLSFDIHSIGTPTIPTDSCNPDAADLFSIGSAGSTWEEVMTWISARTGGIYYIDPDRVFRYVDDSTLQSSYGWTGLSDAPDGVSMLGYRDFELVTDGSKLVNEQFTWGVGQGAAAPVLGHVTDATSIATHGLWQQAELVYDMYCQDSVDLRAETWLNGSPQNRRGSKDDRLTTRVTVFHPYFRVGDVVQLESTSFGVDQAMAVRGAEISFPTPWDIQCVLTVGHELDTPWTAFEFWFPKLGGFDDWRSRWGGLIFPGPWIYDFIVPPWPQWDECVEVCVADEFDREESGLWGTTTLEGGIGWAHFGAGATWDVVDEEAYVLPNIVPFSARATVFDIVTGHDTNIFVQFRVDEISSGDTFVMEIGFLPDGGGTDVGAVVSVIGGNMQLHVRDRDNNLSSPVTIFTGAGEWADVQLKLRVDYSAGNVRARLWRFGAEPATWDTSLAALAISPLNFNVRSVNGTALSHSLYIDEIQICGIEDACRDDFDRTVDDSFGTGPMGEWLQDIAVGNADVGQISVDGSAGVVYPLAGNGNADGFNFWVAPGEEFSLPTEILAKFEWRWNQREDNWNGIFGFDGLPDPMGSSDWIYGAYHPERNGSPPYSWEIEYALETSIGSTALTKSFPVGSTPDDETYITVEMWARLRVESSIAKFKMWKEGTSEPSDWSETTGAFDSLSEGSPPGLWLYSMLFTTASDGVDATWFKILSYKIIEGCVGDPCAGESVVLQPASGGVLYGRHPIGATELENGNFLYKFSQQFQPGSTEVWADGMRLRLGEDYDEHALNASIEIHEDAMAGAVPFDSGMVITANFVPWIIHKLPPEYP